jgi:excisionase family DNA binding protein
MSEELIFQKLDSIERMLLEQNLLKKDVLNLIEASLYLDLSQSHLYKLTSTGAIPCYKPNGKKVYFNRTELDNWLLRNRQTTTSEIEEDVDNFMLKTGRSK